MQELKVVPQSMRVLTNFKRLMVFYEEEVVDMFAKGIYQVLQDNGQRLFDIVSDNNADIE